MLFWAMVIAGCAQSYKNTISPSAATPMISASRVLATETITPISTLSVTDTPTNTATALPTLSVGAAVNRLLELLANNGGCRLPCLWGITPGKSTSQEVQSILSPLSVIRNDYSVAAKFKPDSGFVDLNYSEGDLMLNVETSYLADNQIIKGLRFHTTEYQFGKAPNGEVVAFSFFDSETFGKRVDYYSLSHVLSEQGIPDAVMIATSDSPPISVPSIGFFYIVLLYPEQGIWVKYTTQMNMVGANVHGCPQNAHVEMELFPAGNTDSFFTSLKQNQDWVAQQKNWFQPLEKATSMTLEQFYETFRQPTDKCIETPAKLWTPPKP